VDFAARRPAGVVEYVPSAHLIVQRSAFEAVGGFDASILIAQDMLFNARVKELWPEGIRFQPWMIVRHHGRVSRKAFLEHQKHFGFSRAEYGIRMNRDLLWLGERPYLGWLVALRRLAYISLRVVQWNLVDLPRYLLQLPVMIVGLAA
jgi:GT2 family glycosyltransferase